MSDGATAVVLTSEIVANKMTNRPIFVLACGAATDYLNYSAREDLSRFYSAELAMKSAAQTAQISPSELQLLELPDQSTMTEMVTLEDIGLCQPGTAWKNIYQSYKDNQLYYEVGGKPVYVNTNGGLKADGNPLGAAGGAQIFELYRQLRGEAEDRQIKVPNGLKCGAAVEFEGFGTKAYVSILGEKKQ